MARHIAILPRALVQNRLAFKEQHWKHVSPPCASLSARCRSHGRSHETLIVNGLKVVSFLLQRSHLRFSSCLGCSINRIILFKEVMFLLLESFCSQELALSTSLLFLTNILTQTANE